MASTQPGYLVRPHLRRWILGCVVFAIPVVIGLLALVNGDRIIGILLAALGAPAVFWIFVYAKPMSIRLTERGVEFRTFGRAVQVPYERLQRIWLEHSDNSLLQFFMLGLRMQGSPFASLRGWYLFVVLLPTAMFFAAIGTLNGWKEMVDTWIRSWLFWVLWWVVWGLIFLGVRFLVLPAMKRTRVRDAVLMFDIDPALLDRQPFTRFRSAPIGLSLASISAEDRERIACALEANRVRLPAGALKGATLEELRPGGFERA